MFNSAKAKEFGRSLAEYYGKQVPLNMSGSEQEVLRKEAFAVKFIGEKIAAFKKVEKLNVYKKAAAAGAFKSELTERGYDAKTIDDLTIEVATRLAAR